MNWYQRRITGTAPILLLFFAALWCVLAVPAVADDLRRHVRHDSTISGTSLRPGKDKGNEATGEVAAWIFAVANISVALSLVSRAAVKLPGLSGDSKKRIKLVNQAQKKYGMPLHYLGNSVAFAIACTHFFLSCCRSTTLPEWGLLTMASVVLLGVMIKFRIAPKALRKWTYLLHTSPLVLASILLFLVVGHSMMD